MIFKNSQKLVRGNCLSLMEISDKNPFTNITLDDEVLNTFPQE
jgi:hypothetical protein